MNIFCKQLHFIFIFIFISCFIGCDNNIKTYQIPKDDIQKTLNKISTITSSSNFSWEKPESWMKSEGSQMRLASYKVPYSGYLGDLSVIVLSGDGGGVGANVNRWRGQLDLPTQDEELILTYAEKRKNDLGNYHVFRIINNSNENIAFICSIIPLHSSIIFIKLSIDKVVLKDVESDFIIFCDSFKLAEKS